MNNNRQKGHPIRHRSLDAVRGFAVLLVVFYHASYRFAPDQGDVLGGIIRAIGWIGVDMFFALSGFLIVYILSQQKNRENIRLYFWKRFLRIVPIFAVAILVFALGAYLTGQTDTLPLLPLTALFLNGWLIPFLGEAAVPYTISWSLSIEVFAYIVLGFCAKYSKSALFKSVWIFLIVALMVRLFVFIFRPFDLIGLYFFVPSRLDAIAYGALGAMGLYDRFTASKYAPLFWGSVTVGTILVFSQLMTHPEFIHTLGYAWFGLSVGIWVTSLFQHPQTSDRWLAKILESIGKYSYFIYLFHLFFIEFLLIISQHLGWTNLGFWPASLLAMSLTTFAGIVSWKFVEGPLIAKSRSLPSRLMG